MTAATESNSTPLDSIEPGQNVRVTVAAEPRSAAARKTIERLMRRDPGNAKGLRHAQELRRDRTNSYIRGNRLFHARPKAARVVRAQPGRTWTMRLTADILPDMRSVEGYLKVEQA